MNPYEAPRTSSLHATPLLGAPAHASMPEGWAPLDLGSPTARFAVSADAMSTQIGEMARETIAFAELAEVRLERRLPRGYLVGWSIAAAVSLLLCVASIIGGSRWMMISLPVITIVGLVEALAFRRKLVLVFVARDGRRFERDIGMKLHPFLGYAPRVVREEALARGWQWLAAHLATRGVRATAS